jgi:hypothetical protein
VTLLLRLYSPRSFPSYSISTSDIDTTPQSACYLNMAVIADGSCKGSFACSYMGRDETDGDVIAPVERIGPNSWYVCFAITFCFF